jgi:hypothetical protein
MSVWSVSAQRNDGVILFGDRQVRYEVQGNYLSNFGNIVLQEQTTSDIHIFETEWGVN